MIYKVGEVGYNLTASLSSANSLLDRDPFCAWPANAIRRQGEEKLSLTHSHKLTHSLSSFERTRFLPLFTEHRGLSVCLSVCLSIRDPCSSTTSWISKTQQGCVFLESPPFPCACARVVFEMKERDRDD